MMITVINPTFKQHSISITMTTFFGTTVVTKKLKNNFTSSHLYRFNISWGDGIITHLDWVDNALVSFAETFAVHPAHLLQQAIANILRCDAVRCWLLKSEHKAYI